MLLKIVLRKALLATAANLICLTVLAGAQTPVSAPHLSATERISALKTIKEKFQELYVFPELRSKIVERLNQADRSGRYNIDDPFLFAERITEDLRDVSRDHHLSLAFNPEAYAAAIAPPKSDAGEEAFQRRNAIRNHHGLTEMKRLPGNLRYLKISAFEWIDDETGAVYDEAMCFLKDGDAMIIDLRGNGGGSHAAVQYLVSHFFNERTLELSFLQGSQEPTQSWTLNHLPAGRLTGKPLYVLIDGNVGSAAEAFAYDVQQFKLGELIGAKTVGAANNNKLLPVAPNFILSVSYGRPLHAISKSNWEGIGVTPTVEAPSLQALEVAQLLALKRLTENIPVPKPEILAEYSWARTELEARFHPVTFTPAQLKALAGRYGTANTAYGERTVDFIDGALWLKRTNRPVVRLSPLTTDGLFAIEGIDYMRVRLTGKTLEMFWSDDPTPRVFIRN
jgi:hypothetical protein